MMQDLRVCKGVRNRANVIPFEDLTTKYHYKTTLPEEDTARIWASLKPVFEKLEENAHFSFENTEGYKKVKSLYPAFSKEWELSWTCRNIVASHESLPDYLIKMMVFKSPCYGPMPCHPMASTLRVPMAHLIRKNLIKYYLDTIVVPEKGLIPLTSLSIIDKFDEDNVNKAFLAVAKKLTLIPKEETVSTIKEFKDEKQKKLANQLCFVPELNGLGDITWQNLRLTPDHKIGIVDTEPLYGALFTDRFDEKYKYCKEMAQNNPLKVCAKRGLTILGKSSDDYDLEIFHNETQSFLERYD